jgi:hypothetical protein
MKTMKKAQNGAKSKTSLGMKSVKAGYDNNPGVTRADIITAATKKAQNGKKMQGVKGMSENEKLKKGITRLAPVNGKPVKKAAIGALLPLAMKAAPMIAGMFGGKGKGGGGGGLGGMLGGLSGLMGGKNGKTIKKSRSGSSIKKAQDGDYLDSTEIIAKAGPMRKTKIKERSTDGNYVTKTVTRTRPAGTTTSSKTRRTLQGYLTGAPRANEIKKKNGGKAKSGASMKKCKGGC